MFIVLMVVNKFVVTEVYTLFPVKEFNTVQRQYFRISHIEVDSCFLCA